MEREEIRERISCGMQDDYLRHMKMMMKLTKYTLLGFAVIIAILIITV